MADTKREIERKFEFTTPGAEQRGVPDLTGTAGIAAVVDQGVTDLDAVYYDTPDQRLAADGLTLRRRTGGHDSGWHLKLPVAPGVRDEVTAPLGDTVHQMRVASRRLRSALKTYRKVLDREVTDPIGEELRRLGTELGADRDREVLHEHFRTALADLPRPLQAGPVRGRLRTWNTTRRAASRRRALTVLDSPRHLTLLDTLEALLTDPPLLPGAAKPAAKALPKAVLRDYARLASRVEHALSLDPGQEADRALHQARKAAKRARYAAEAAEPALGKPARKFAKAMKGVQSLLGEHQDSVVARAALRELAHQAHGAGEPSFTWGLLHGREEARAERVERALPAAWAEAAAPGLRAALK
ncbi:CYTH and CHAD domain-containing protein [Streptomyces sp. WAC07061]|uniref:CYTH and CHAD domain-containing protein n=1 Tax=Streptomyces sp. WAC07061 TaxID=2487410 RepID=UPI000F778DA4|nr:CYTH and CHAD domain-containing protein [Streptomyces sp. WAC07061]RSS58228.1 CYTH and CHAD domain-containing protein [Streptomyces sp. WAC07061]